MAVDRTNTRTCQLGRLQFRPHRDLELLGRNIAVLVCFLLELCLDIVGRCHVSVSDRSRVIMLQCNCIKFFQMAEHGRCCQLVGKWRLWRFIYSSENNTTNSEIFLNKILSRSSIPLYWPICHAIAIKGSIADNQVFAVHLRRVH